MNWRLLLTLIGLVFVRTAWAAPGVALFYGANPPWNELKAFDVVVVDPGHVPDPRPMQDARTSVFAYVAVGEVHPARDYAKDIPASWRAGENTAWKSIVIDQSVPEWPRFFADRVIKPLWERGYRGFFFDTLDSYHLVAKTPETRAAQEAGMIALVRLVRERFPGVKLIFNRGFEVLPQLHEHVYMVAAESLFRGWDAGAGRYREVPAADREWLLGQLNRVVNEYRLPVLAIDYVAPADRALARDTAARIRKLGFIPWVSTPGLDSMGVGALEVMPRRVLMLYDGTGNPADLAYESIHRYVQMPLNHLGYVSEYVDVMHDALPAGTLAGTYAGIVAWFDDQITGARRTALEAWLAQQARDGVRIVLLNNLGLPAGSSLMKDLGMERGSAAAPKSVTAVTRDPIIGYEVDLPPDRRSFFPLRSADARPLLRLRSDTGQTMDAVAYTPWGGYALGPYAIVFLPGEVQRWVIDPIVFLRTALQLPEMPVPDVTTEAGRRLMIVHIDGDGFASRAEFGGGAFAGEVMVKEFLERYRVPTTASVIQGEVAANGLYPADSPQLEAIARRMFALPHVEIASHSFSHPFQWQKAVKAAEFSQYQYYLKIPGYTFSLDAEIRGSLDYIDRRLAPPGKRAKVFLWTGDSNPTPDAVGMTYAAGVGNMNGGDTNITRSQPSLTRVAPLGIIKGPWFQVYAANQNENVYTGLWTESYYGFRRAIETFEMTDQPRRLKPINIYYHTYSASKRASFDALHEVYRWALKQPVFHIYGSEYIERVVDFRSLVVARDGEDWVVRGAGALRELRMPAALGVPDIVASRGVAGHSMHNGERYVHLTAPEAILRTTDRSAMPYMESANGRIADFDARTQAAETRLSFSLTAAMPVALSFGNARNCTFVADGERAGAVDSAGNLTVQLKKHAVQSAILTCR